MGLETPLALLGLLAAALPLLAHRMKRRELPRIVLPTFALLQRATAQSQRKRSLTDTLLLMLRIAILATASIAIAAPYVTAHLAFGDGKVACMAIVIDDSLSMARRERGQTLLSLAKERAQEVVSALPQGSEVTIVLAGKPARVLSPLSRELSGASHKLDAIPKLASRGGDLSSAIGLAVRVMGSTHLPRRRLLVLSDFARHNALDANALKIDGIETRCERMGELPRRGNLHIESVSSAQDPTQHGRTSIAVELVGQGTLDPHARVEVLQGGSVVGHSDVTLQADRAKTVLSVPTPDDKGDPVAVVRVISDDELDADNEAGIVLTRADALRVLLVDGDPHPASDDDELHYVRRALSLVPENVLALSVQTVDPLLLGRVSLSDVDVIVLANVPTPDAASAERLRRFVEQGGGFLVAAGDHVQPSAYNAVLSSVLATHIASLSVANDLQFAAPRDTAFLPEGLTGLRETRTRKRLLLDAGAQTLLAFTDGSPALAARDIGSGRSLLLATSLDDDFTDLPLRPGFLPLLVAMLRDAAGASAIARNQIAPGDVVELPVPRGATFIEVVRPDDQVQRFDVVNDARSFRFSATEAIGAYQVRSETRSAPGHPSPRGAFVVSAARDESDLSAGPVPAAQGATAAGGAGDVHRSLASSVFLLAGLLVLAEGFARLRKRS